MVVKLILQLHAFATFICVYLIYKRTISKRMGVFKDEKSPEAEGEILRKILMGFEFKIEAWKIFNKFSLSTMN